MRFWEEKDPLHYQWANLWPQGRWELEADREPLLDQAQDPATVAHREYVQNLVTVAHTVNRRTNRGMRNHLISRPSGRNVICHIQGDEAVDKQVLNGFLGNDVQGRYQPRICRKCRIKRAHRRRRPSWSGVHLKQAAHRGTQLCLCAHVGQVCQVSKEGGAEQYSPLWIALWQGPQVLGNNCLKRSPSCD